MHPVVLKYNFLGDLNSSLEPVLSDLEARLSWYPQTELPLLQRVAKLGGALLSLKEMEIMGEVQSGNFDDRVVRLVDGLLQPLEQQYLAGHREPHVFARVNRLRSVIVPEMIARTISREEHDRRWRQLTRINCAQELGCYPSHYLQGRPSKERILETVERYEESLTGVARIHRPLKVMIDVGEAIEVQPRQNRRATIDPLMQELREQMQATIERFAAKSERTGKPKR
jgi:hypothetical protein